MISRRRSLFKLKKISTSPRNNNLQLDSPSLKPNPDRFRAFERPDSSLSTQATMPDSDTKPEIPMLFTSMPPIKSALQTETSILQDLTVERCLPLLTGSKGSATRNAHGLLPLERQRHIDFLHDGLRDLPSAYVSQDSSRPWMLYWALTGLCLLGEDVTIYRER